MSTAGASDDWLLPPAPPPGKRLAVRVTPDALRQIRGGHPWVFDRAVTSVSHPGAAGDLAVVFDASRAFAAIGLWDPTSPIRLKVLHAGRPETIDGGFFARRVAEAVDRRAHIAAAGHTDAYRVVHGENDRLPGLVVDRYGDVLVVKLYSAAWWPHLPTVVEPLRARLTPRAVVLRLARNVAAELRGRLGDGDLVCGALDDPVVVFSENGLSFEADVVRGQKTGHFLDQRDNRARVRDRSAGARVLDVFGHTGGFSVYAAAGGATLVHTVDRSEPALAAARRNMARNAESTAAARHRTSTGDAFEVLDVLAAEGERYDVVVIDPPSFASRRDDVDGAVRAYRKLTELGARVTAHGGLLVQASCSSRVDAHTFVATVRAGLAAAGAVASDVVVTGHADDHPIGFPEGAYLNAAFARLDSAGR